MKNVFYKFKKLYRIIRNDYIVLFKKGILISASVSFDKQGELIHSNWGDDLNLYLLKQISIYPVVFNKETLLAKYIKNNYLVIGSTIGMESNKRTIIWGAGLLSDDYINSIKINKVLAVRGPLTRAKLINIGIKCPERYGDPALLLPYLYNPKVSKKYAIGIIPHYSDIEALSYLPAISDIHCIKTRNYKNWLDFITEILSCEYVVSSSLHGIIISEAYGIPSHWIEFSGTIKKDHFKYIDFYKSINKGQEKPYLINKFTTINDLIKICKQWKKTEINVNDLIESCPFPINIRKYE